VVFDGHAEGRCDRVVFVEIKSGGGTLSPIERQVREAVVAGRVEWREVRMP
jgi:predicted Holliday junction resolvase-like endonuclease